MKKRLEHFWYYYKWHAISALIVLAVAVDFAVQKSTPVPELQCGVVGVSSWTEEMSENLSRQLSGLYSCSFGVNFYLWGEENAADPAKLAADSVHLAADISERISLFYISDAEDFQKEAGLVRFCEAEETVLELPEGLKLLCSEENKEKLKKILK